MRILIIAVQKAKKQHYRSLLSGWGIECTAVNNSLDALRLFNEALVQGVPYQLVMTDYLLSGQMTGLGLARIFSDVYSAARILIFPCAALFEQDVIQEYNEIRENMVDPKLSSKGLREIIAGIASDRTLQETKYESVISKSLGLE